MFRSVRKILGWTIVLYGIVATALQTALQIQGGSFTAHDARNILLLLILLTLLARLRQSSADSSIFIWLLIVSALFTIYTGFSIPFYGLTIYNWWALPGIFFIGGCLLRDQWRHRQLLNRGL